MSLQNKQITEGPLSSSPKETNIPASEDPPTPSNPPWTLQQAIEECARLWNSFYVYKRMWTGIHSIVSNESALRSVSHFLKNSNQDRENKRERVIALGNDHWSKIEEDLRSLCVEFSNAVLLAKHPMQRTTKEDYTHWRIYVLGWTEIWEGKWEDMWPVAEQENLFASIGKHSAGESTADIPK